MSERDRIEQALTFDTGCEPSAQEIIDALNRAGFQITPQAGAEPISDGFARYRRKEFAELRPYLEGETLSERVSIGKQDKKNGSPRVGDMIARNPKNHNDQWLIAAQYFAENFEVYRTAPPRPVAPRVEPTDKQKQLFVQYASRVSKHGYTSENQKIAQRALHKIFALPPDSPGATEGS